MLHINRKGSKLAIWYRFPFQCYSHPVIYLQVLVEDDNGVNAIFDMLGYQYGFAHGCRAHKKPPRCFSIQYANEGPNASFSYSHSGHFHDPNATHTGHYSENVAHSPINIGGVDYHAPYTHVATEDQQVPYRPMNTQ